MKSIKVVKPSYGTHDYQLIVKFKHKTLKLEAGELFEIAQQATV